MVVRPRARSISSAFPLRPSSRTRSACDCSRAGEKRSTGPRSHSITGRPLCRQSVAPVVRSRAVAPVPSLAATTRTFLSCAMPRPVTVDRQTSRPVGGSTPIEPSSVPMTTRSSSTSSGFAPGPSCAQATVPVLACRAVPPMMIRSPVLADSPFGLCAAAGIFHCGGDCGRPATGTTAPATRTTAAPALSASLETVPRAVSTTTQTTPPTTAATPIPYARWPRRHTIVARIRPAPTSTTRPAAAYRRGEGTSSA